MTAGNIMRSMTRGWLALLLIAVALGPVCFAMSPAMAMAAQPAATSGCGSATPTISCAHCAPTKSVPKAPDTQQPVVLSDPQEFVAPLVVEVLAESVLAQADAPEGNPTPLRL